ncbi:hypothetical protein NPIL_533761 [Nephila pilipes]|uniref:Uncharacterized protein n=1 Tax=Nephila pilipes TaxID=299642 RepID=A0A8X6PD38_NEPPI|nr:hypothetical protein NPIL_533761 [Nephila pilipes]
MCRNWFAYTKRENLAEGDIKKLMKFLAEEVEGAVAANNIKGLLVSEYYIKSSLENFYVRSKPFTKKGKIHPFALSAKLVNIDLNITTLRRT